MKDTIEKDGNKDWEVMKDKIKKYETKIKKLWKLKIEKLWNPLTCKIYTKAAVTIKQRKNNLIKMNTCFSVKWRNYLTWALEEKLRGIEPLRFYLFHFVRKR